MDPPSNIGWFCFHETIVSHICTKLTFTLFAFTLIARKIAILLTKVTINKAVNQSLDHVKLFHLKLWILLQKSVQIVIRVV